MGRDAKRVSGAKQTVPWQRRLQRHAQSGSSVTAFCARETVGEAAFYYWRRKLGAWSDKMAKPASEDRFVDVGLTRMANGSAPQAWGAGAADRAVEVQINMGGGMVLRIVRR